MCLRYSFAMTREADMLEQAIADTLAKGLRTADIFSEGAKGAKKVGTRRWAPPSSRRSAARRGVSAHAHLRQSGACRAVEHLAIVVVASPFIFGCLELWRAGACRAPKASASGYLFAALFLGGGVYGVLRLLMAAIPMPSCGGPRSGSAAGDYRALAAVHVETDRRGRPTG